MADKQTIEKLGTARRLGAEAFAEGRPCIPALNPGLMALLAGVPVGKGLPIMKAWLGAWIEAPIGGIRFADASTINNDKVQCADCWQWVKRDENHTCKQQVRRNQRQARERKSC